ncbi:exonuclease domain-containing protein [Kitasatospora sp. NPDC088346]|uniref:3'-5' exonuclease n=1 Tax=Kitasatospora sp. NPDC088346 TaxID=3364073 RepID=UPI0038268590
MLLGRLPDPPVPGGFAVVDVEATGRSPWRHRVVEVAVVLLDRRFAVEGEFATLVDPAGPVGPTHVHRITQEQVVGAPRFRDIAPTLLELLADRVLVGHHVSCDRVFLEREFARIGVDLPAVPELCTMRLARSRLVGAGGYGLAACVAAAGLGRYPAHTALGDARAAADLLRHCAGAPGPADDGGADGPGDWVVPPLGDASRPWPRLPRPRGERPGEGVALVRRELPSGQVSPGTDCPHAALSAAGGE